MNTVIQQSRPTVSIDQARPQAIVARMPNIPGSRGISIQSTIVDGTGHLIITLSNGVQIDAGYVKGTDGVGIAGVSVSNVAIDQNGHLIVTLSNATQIDAGTLVDQVATAAIQEHITAAGNPHGTTAADVGADPAGTAAAAVAALVGSTPETLDTLKELADALGDDPNFAATTAAAIGNKIDKSLATAANQFLVSSGIGAFVTKTVDDIKTLLGLGSAAYKNVGTTADTVMAGDATFPAETVATMGALINSAGAITTPADVDKFCFRDNASGLLAYVSFANIKATLLAWLINILEGRTDLVATNGSTMTLDMAFCRNFEIDASGFTGGAYSIAVANQPVGNVTPIFLILKTGATTLPTVTWPNGASYTLTASKTHWLSLISTDGTTWRIIEAVVF